MDPNYFQATDQSLFLAGPAGALQAVCLGGDVAGKFAGHNFIAVVAHPHPQHGGTMENKVVSTLVRSYRQLGIDTVRFNFRGVGASAGSFDSGRGEVEDVLAVVQWLVENFPSHRLLLAGFSFGSAMVAAASHRLLGKIEHLLLVAPPVERYAYDRNGKFVCQACTIIGDEDELVDVAGLHRWAAGLTSPHALIAMPQASHFFHGKLTPLKAHIVAHLEQVLAISKEG